MEMEFNGIPIRAVCSDIDGTLLDSRRELSLKTIEAIKAIRDTMPVILASSRMPAAMRHLQRELLIENHPLICYNGGYVVRYNQASPQVIHSTEIPIDVCNDIINITKETSLHVSLYREDQWYAPQMDEWTNREATITKVDPEILSNAEVLERWRIESNGSHKIMIMGDATEISFVEQSLRRTLSNQIHVYHSKSTYLELAPKSISKASALGLVLEKCFSLSMENVIAFGDNFNDVELIQSVGWGVAVDNAREEVKAVAKEITRAGKDDGVAYSLFQHFTRGQNKGA